MKNEGFSLENFSLRGKNAIVTGGNSGLGHAFSEALAKGGANVLVVSRSGYMDNTKKVVEDSGVRFEYIKEDLTKEGACKRVVDACISRLGSVDILVNSAGICINIEDVRNFTRVEWDQMVSVNLTAPYEMAHEACKYMIPNGGGKIINIASLYSFLGGQWSPAYAATKHGIAGLTKSLCDELAGYNIQVNAIAPGYFSTKLTEKTRMNEKENSRVISHIPANRWGEPEDLMGACVFLASKASQYVNGHILTVDGGYLMR